MNQPTWAVLVLAGLAAGCELVAGIQDKYLATADAGSQIGPSDTGSPPAPDDAASDHPDATVPETNDAGPTGDALEAADVPGDAGTTPVDAAVDAGNNNFTPPDAGTMDPSAPCTMQPTYIFCDDFDTETMVGQPWTWHIFTVDGGASSFATSAYTSPPRSFEVISPPAGPPSVELLGLDLGTLNSQVRLAFDVRIDMDSLTGLAPTAIAQILGARSGTGMELDYVIRPNQGAQLVGYVSLDGGPSLNIPLPAPPLRTWTRIVVAYDQGAGVTVYEDGQQVGANTSAAGGAPNDTKIQVGMIYENGVGSATLQMEMDNVVVRGH
jgi:hypothetical protein